jgi:hypothetical protein
MAGLYNNKSEADILNESLSQLGLESDKGKLLYFVKNKEQYVHEPSIWFQLERAGLYEADAVFFKKGIREKEYIPQIYVYDQTNLEIAEPNHLTEIHKKIWTGGEAPLVCVCSKTEIKILDTTRPVREVEGGFLPIYLIENLKTVAKGHAIYNESFAQKLKSGTYWDNSNVDFYKSSYSQLTALLRRVIDKFTDKSGLGNNKEIVQRLIIQCILVKYLEERKDENDNTVFPAHFFEKYDKATQFSDVLKKGLAFDFFADLNKDHFNGGIFAWDDTKNLFDNKQRAFDYLAKVLRGYVNTMDQQIIEFEDNFSRLYSFNYIPVELISRLYEEFIIKENKKREQESGNGDNAQKKNDGVAYTPSHLVKLLVNEAMPLDKAPENLNDFKVLDPACGSAIFLVVAFKRIVQWWRQKNKYAKPKIVDLMPLLNSIYGVDIDPKAVQISVFSLCIALCDELSPKEIWDELKFEKLDGRTVFCKDFFEWKEETPESLRFDLIIGNPPFMRGGLNKKLRTWTVNDVIIEIPQKQIALKFLCESLSLLKNNGLSCLIVKSLPLLYSNSDYSKNYLKELAQQYHINQIFDFTPLARNGVLWDGVDVDSAAIFVTNAKPEHEKNILHAIFRRSKANKERIYFEIDKYDLHFILRDEVYKSPYIFKINLLGGGRLRNLYSKVAYIQNIDDYLARSNCQANEGFMFGKEGDLAEDFMYEYPTLPTRAFDEHGIDFDKLDYIDKKQKFISIKNRLTYEFPNILIKENIGENKIPIYLNKSKKFTFKDKIISIYSLEKKSEPLEKLYKSLSSFQGLHRLIVFLTSSQLLVGKNTAILKEDIMRLPVLKETFKLSSVETNIIQDVLKYTQYFIRRPETAETLKPLKSVKEEIPFFGDEFSAAINELYADEVNSFKLTDIIVFEKENLIGTLFSYDDRRDVTPQLIEGKEVTKIEGLINFDINESLTATRIIQYYASNKVLFVKPNQKRYWLASVAYRDADGLFADILNNQ